MCGQRWIMREYFISQTNRILENIFRDPYETVRDDSVGQVQQFCARFKNAEIANDFKSKFEECQAKLLDNTIRIETDEEK